MITKDFAKTIVAFACDRSNLQDLLDDVWCLCEDMELNKSQCEFAIRLAKMVYINVE